MALAEARRLDERGSGGSTGGRREPWTLRAARAVLEVRERGGQEAARRGVVAIVQHAVVEAAEPRGVLERMKGDGRARERPLYVVDLPGPVQGGGGGGRAGGAG